MWYRYSQQLQLPEIDVEQNPVQEKPKTEKQRKQELLETQKPTPSLFFSDWSKDHYVPERPLYHGTTHEFNRFDINKGVSSNAFGQGFDLKVIKTFIVPFCHIYFLSRIILLGMYSFNNIKIKRSQRINLIGKCC